MKITRAICALSSELFFLHEKVEAVLEWADSDAIQRIRKAGDHELANSLEALRLEYQRLQRIPHWFTEGSDAP